MNSYVELVKAYPLYTAMLQFAVLGTFGDVISKWMQQGKVFMPYKAQTLILKMLEGTKYENISLLGCVIVLLKGDSEFEEFKIPSKTINKVMNLKLSDYGI